MPLILPDDIQHRLELRATALGLSPAETVDYLLRRLRTPRDSSLPFELRPPDHPDGADYYVEPDTGCWLWTGVITRLGYAYAHINGKNTQVARYMIRDQLTPDKPLALHKPLICHNRSCINPDHLYAGTQKENMADRILDGTTHHGHTWSRGTKNGNARLTEAQVLDIYRRTQAGNEKQRDIAREYGITEMVVSKIKHGKAWNWLTNHST